ncbi:hypothetical protein VF14_19225 [Nostoc linckia z18]|jgi:hypothetical protein|uniref:Uncharacterized protein n=2 Tax=Nostoc linckia TaxID=92942 RepID=A0A9Q6ELC1_NOSLI|nr:hypothetical protein [Nostoc linckia]PHJ84778.1 hypothetical protein VF06_08765 [Nostoc linckia z4]PHJ93387.1 hypothetical protein VF04_26000 [Nostoc linckia z7]PHK03479.1 hypothetical protein VF08_14905 [Nostoc linckia z8]PHK09099.1 hypothetical protein VF09_17000 [Nostoc linckia z9]PHK26080.1 hypothetical protein VF10_04620 [Nostoc linckia z13]PHK32881.1 hypothetical protein VF14_19225 [Nostoc linckia z18]PHK40019.1 hypothetical protein VF12_12060 [Nostoc linckia z15]PHK44779.1 hypothe
MRSGYVFVTKLQNRGFFTINQLLLLPEKKLYLGKASDRQLSKLQKMNYFTSSRGLLTVNC